jgi:hypothetical protein
LSILALGYLGGASLTKHGENELQVGHMITQVGGLSPY